MFGFKNMFLEIEIKEIGIRYNAGKSTFTIYFYTIPFTATIPF